MKVLTTSLKDVLLIEQDVFGDRRGYFMETYQKKCSAFYDPGSEGGILWSDPAIGIDWPLENFLLSDKDLKYPCLKDVPAERLPVMEVKSCRSYQQEQTGRLAGSLPASELNTVLTPSL